MLSGSGPNALTGSYSNTLNAGNGYSLPLKVLWGDVNGDGVVNSADVAVLRTRNQYETAAVSERKFVQPTKRSITFLFTTLLVACALPARADIVFSAQSTSALPGDMGDTFEVDITNKGSSAVQIGGFVFEITTTNPDVMFTDVTDATTAFTCIFNGNSLFGPDLALSSPGQTFDAADASSYTSLDAGATLELGLVFFDVSPDANVPETVTVSFNLNNSSLSDGDGNPIPIDGSRSGSIDVVPEPSGMVGLALALGLLGWRKRTRLTR